MQIHEITQQHLHEDLRGIAQGVAGAFDRARGAVSGAVQGYQQSKQSRETAKSLQAVTDKAVKVWQQYASNLRAATPDPARYATLYKQALTAFVQKNLLKNQPISSSINKLELTQLIDAIVDVESNPREVARLFSQLVQQSALSAQDVNQTTLVKVVSTSPPVIQYRGINYAINQSGEWANQTTSKVPDESFQAFLDSEARKAGVSI